LKDDNPFLIDISGTEDQKCMGIFTGKSSTLLDKNEQLSFERLLEKTTRFEQSTDAGKTLNLNSSVGSDEEPQDLDGERHEDFEGHILG
jgi:hypothetical protein